MIWLLDMVYDFQIKDELGTLLGSTSAMSYTEALREVLSVPDTDEKLVYVEGVPGCWTYCYGGAKKYKVHLLNWKHGEHVKQV